MLKLSDIIIQHHEINSFAELLQVVRKSGEQGLVLIEFDLKPDFGDTPRDWETALEIAFTARR
ncbi:MAG: hypothetical protein QGH73_15465 [Rhodospirillales bacterium]|jgi:hypothetical protein|nr:sulfur relay protein DsrC [Rhodospirillaceae bacterium]MDP6428176.1 hypothetical protein [Rhodospirillales bacterium]MDP6642941.1 hypothetical protein [Rhodospirillales bacterium]MDP6843068.1 hypothetical protein [Rhodospirillales bacterium]|tara:strand:- start:1582 stop:1770 length:189 start_codon:yes stop_codon:yes gene_type:complete